MFTSCVGGLIGTPFMFHVILLSEEKTTVLLTFKKLGSQVPKANVEEGSSAQIALKNIIFAKLNNPSGAVPRKTVYLLQIKVLNPGDLIGHLGNRFTAFLFWVIGSNTNKVSTELQRQYFSPCEAWL